MSLDTPTTKKAEFRICADCGRDRPRKARGRCGTCYTKWLKQTNPEFQQRELERARAWSQAHPERHAEHERNRRARLGDEHRRRERIRQQSPKRQAWIRAYSANNKEYFVRKQREYRQRHPDIANARWAKWHAENPEKVALKNLINDQRRLAREKALPATLTADQWRAIKAAYRHRCAYCGKKSERLTQDHVIPLSAGGGYTPENIVPACRSCNSRKGNRPAPIEPPKRLLL